MIVALFSSVSQIAAATCERRVRLISPNSKLLIAVSIGANLAITSLTLLPLMKKLLLHQIRPVKVNDMTSWSLLRDLIG